jgi:hypothetical protein
MSTKDLDAVHTCAETIVPPGIQDVFSFIMHLMARHDLLYNVTTT